MRRRCSTDSQRQTPTGFTLIELLVVIVILALLIGLLLPAVMRAVSRAREAAVAAEIQALGQALADFKSKYNEFPPSRIVVSEGGDYSAGTLGAMQPLASRSVTALKRYWPRISLNTTGSAGYAPGITASNFYDINGNGNLDPPYVMTGPECLVFFLGGIPLNSGGSWSVTGFSKNPANPFLPASITTNRTVPLYEFNNGRLVSCAFNSTAPTNQDGTRGMPGYIDSLGAPAETTLTPYYVYFSAYGGAGYDPDDCDMTETDTSGSGSISGAFTAPGSVIIPATSKPASYPTIASLAPNPYTSSAPVPTNATGNAAASTKPRAWINQTSYQLISPGLDRYYGIGGQYIAQGTSRLPFVDATKTTNYVADSLQTIQANPSVGTDIRSRESDNLTNFAPGGRLD